LSVILIALQRCHHFNMWNDTDTPLAYFISFRSYGTWLHGDKRGSIDRKWLLQAINVRTNHIHTVVSANRKADLVLNAFKANATRQLRQDAIWTPTFSPWADGGSRRRLWNEQSVAKAIDYVLNGQGDDLPDFDD